MVQQGHNYMHYGFVYHQVYQLFEAKHVELAGVHINFMYGIITTVLYKKKLHVFMIHPVFTSL